MHQTSVFGPNERKFYIDGAWATPRSHMTTAVINPATEEPVARISLGDQADLDAAVASARAAFPSFSQTSREERLDLLSRILAGLEARNEEMGRAISMEMGAPIGMAVSDQAWSGPTHFREMVRALEAFEFETQRGTTRVAREPIGVCGLITPWNWPINQVANKVAPALAAGCTMVLKPSEVAPLDALLFAEILHEAGVPKGVFNLVNGDGPTIGNAISAHPGIDMVSFTGSTRAGIQVAKVAADTVKRVHQELGGKSANILLDDVDLEDAVTKGVRRCFGNTGQSCDSPTRMLVPARFYEDALGIAKAAAEGFRVGDPSDPATTMGPVANRTQFGRVQRLVQAGIDEGARVVTGGTGRPGGLNRGYFVKPTVFGGVVPSMTIAREEIFGPVLSVMSYGSDEEAIGIANDTAYGLAAYVQGRDIERARAVARRMRAGQVFINYPDFDPSAPFGGYKQSGNGREFSDWGLESYLEIKGMIGYGAA